MDTVLIAIYKIVLVSYYRIILYCSISTIKIKRANNNDTRFEKIEVVF